MLISLHDRERIEAYLRQEPYVNIYSLGDLDGGQWPFTVWYGLADGDRLRALALVYTRLSTPTLLALGGAGDQEHLRRLVGEMAPLLPPRLYAHLNLGLSDILAARYDVASRGEHYKMAWADRSRLGGVATDGVVRLGPGDAEELSAFYAASYPEAFFEPCMLEAGPWMAVRDRAGRLLSVAGLHVCSVAYRVAAAGTIATHPDHRSRGHARAAVAGLCRELEGTMDHIGLNVKADNTAAIRCYRALGFEPVASYEECLLTLRDNATKYGRSPEKSCRKNPVDIQGHEY